MTATGPTTETRSRLGERTADALRAGCSDVRVGPYLLLRPLGEGGMGRVYLARHTDLGRSAALKLLLDSAADPLARERFRREARAAAALDHPNVVRLYDIGREGDAEYLVMEAVDGLDLQQHLTIRGPLPFGVAAGYVCQAAAGLAQAHDRGIVHRDIKPANLMLTPAGVVKVLDLGLARSIEDPADALTSPGPDGGITGTVDYLSPEQAVNGPVDPRTDVYGLGATLAALVTGGPPYVGTVAQKLLQHQLAPPPDLHRETGGRVPAEFAAVVVRMMAKRPDDRPQSAAEVVRLLAPWVIEADLDGETDPTPTHSDNPNAPTVRLPVSEIVVPPPPRRSRRWRYTARVGVALAITVGVAFAAGLFAPTPAPVSQPPAVGAGPRLLYQLDLTTAAVFDVTANSTLPDAEFAAPLTGWHRNTWEPDCTARYRLADIDGSRALGVSVDRPGSQLAFRMPAETFHGCPPGTALRVTFECRADGPAEGYCTVKALPTLRPLAELFVPNAGGWVRRSFTFPIPQEAQVEIAFRSASAIWVRGLEVTAEAGMPTTAEVVYETHFRGVQPFTRVLGTAAVVSGLDSPDILEAGWLYQRAEGSGSATFAATAREAETVLSVSATGSGAAQWVFHPDNGVSAALASNARYRVTVEYAAESAGELTAHERDVWVVLAVAKLPATRGWATAEMTFVTPPARGVQYAFAPASDGKPLRVRRLQLERLPDAPPSGKPVVSVDGSTFAALTYRVAHHEQVKGTGDGRLPNDWRFESYQKDGVAELATGSDRGHPHFAIRNVAGEGAQLYQYQPGAPLKAGVPHRVTVEYRTAAGTAACIELRDGDVSHWTDSPFKTCLPATDGEWVTRHYEIVPPRAWPPVLVLQNHTADAGNEFCVRRLTVTPLR